MNNMAKDKRSISQASSYAAIGEFWDTHDAGEFWDQTEPAAFTVDLQSVTTYYAVEAHLADRLREVARQAGVSAETLINLWVQEKVAMQVPG
jgi:hypothetical protein